MQAKPEPQQQPVIGDDGELLAEDQNADAEQYAEYVQRYTPRTPLSIRLREHFAEWGYIYLLIPFVVLGIAGLIWMIASPICLPAMIWVAVAFIGLYGLGTFYKKVSQDQVESAFRLSLIPLRLAGNMLRSVLLFIRLHRKWLYRVLPLIPIVLLVSFIRNLRPDQILLCVVALLCVGVLFVFKRYDSRAQSGKSK